LGQKFKNLGQEDYSGTSALFVRHVVIEPDHAFCLFHLFVS